MDPVFFSFRFPPFLLPCFLCFRGSGEGSVRFCHVLSSLKSPPFLYLVTFSFLFFVEEVEKEVLDFVMFYLRSLNSSPSLQPNSPPTNVTLPSVPMMLYSRSISSAKLPFLWKEARINVDISPQVSTFCEMVPSYAIFSHCIILPFPRATVIDLMRNILNRGVGLLVYNSKLALSYRARAWAVMRSITVKGLFFFCTVLVKVIEYYLSLFNYFYNNV